MREKNWSADVLFWCFVLFWVIGGFLSLYFIARKEQKRLGGSAFQALLADKDNLPVPMYMGYTLVVISGWLHIVLPLCIKFLCWILLSGKETVLQIVTIFSQNQKRRSRQ